MPYLKLCPYTINPQKLDFIKPLKYNIYIL